MRIFLNFILWLELLILNLAREVRAVVGGANAIGSEFLFQVSLQNRMTDQNYQHYCGGTILNENFVLTAAHCIVGKTQNIIQILAGTKNLNNTRTGSIHGIINRPFVHPQYQHPPHANDIALLKVYPSFVFNEFVKKVAIQPRRLSKDQKIHMAGWGRVNQDVPTPSRLLKKAEVYVIEKCNPILDNDYIGEFCTVNKNVMIRKRGSCKGDSGGPATLDKSNLVGVIVGSNYPNPTRPICGESIYPDRYTNVSHYIDWIGETIQNNMITVYQRQTEIPERKRSTPRTRQSTPRRSRGKKNKT